MSSTHNWGRWGTNDQAGAANLVNASVTLSAVGLVKEGVVVSLAQPAGAGAAVPPHRGKGQRFMDRDAGDYALGARVVGQFKFAEDTLVISSHSGTHMDALCHVWEGSHLYNEVPESTVRSTTGARQLGADSLQSVVTRGVLIDVVTQRGRPLNPSEEVKVADLTEGYRRAGTEPRSGDAIFIRTGWWESKGATTEYFDNEPGIAETAGEWLGHADVAYVGTDNYGIEVQPSRHGTRFPVHLQLLHKRGVLLIENLDLSKLAGRVGPFMTVLAPIGFKGSTAGPITPLAVW